MASRFDNKLQDAGFMYEGRLRSFQDYPEENWRPFLLKRESLHPMENSVGVMSGCGGHHSHDSGGAHSHEPPEIGVSYTLYQKIDLENIQCLNESIENSGRTIFKPWEERMNFDKFVESDTDEELLLNIPFTDQIKLKGIIIIGGENGYHPNKLRLFKNRPYMTFDDASGKADQEMELYPDPNGTLEYNPKIVTFSSVTHLTMHFPSNFGEETTKIYYIGLKGEYSKAHRHGVTLCSYETTPQMSDHKEKAFDGVGRPVT